MPVASGLKPIPVEALTVTRESTLTDFVEAASSECDESPDTDESLEAADEAPDDERPADEVTAADEAPDDERPADEVTAHTDRPGEEEILADSSSGPTSDEPSGPRSNVPTATALPEPTGNSQLSSIATAGWGEYACDRCEETVERVWQVDGQAVCPACKEW